MPFGHIPQHARGMLRCDITLRFGRHLVTDEELPHRGRAQQWRIIDRMQPPVAVVAPIRGSGMPSHGVRKGCLKQIVVSCGQTLDQIRQGVTLRSRCKRRKVADKPPRQDHRLDKATPPRTAPARPSVHSSRSGDPSFPVRSKVIPQEIRPCRAKYALWLASFCAGIVGRCLAAHTWQCGCGLLHPIIAPLFSKTCT